MIPRHFTSIIPGVHRELYKQLNYEFNPEDRWKGRPDIIFKEKPKPYYDDNGDLIDRNGEVFKAIGKVKENASGFIDYAIE